MTDVLRDYTVIDDAVLISEPFPKMLAAVKGDGTANAITIVPYVAGKLIIFLPGWGFWTPGNTIIIAAGIDYDYTETDPASGIITPRQAVQPDQPIIVYGVAA